MNQCVYCDVYFSKWIDAHGDLFTHICKSWCKPIIKNDLLPMSDGEEHGTDYAHDL